MVLNPARVQSIDRAASVLEMLGTRGSAGVSEVARELDVHRSTAYRILATLNDRELVRQDPETEKYALGPAVLKLARALTSNQDLVAVAAPICDALCDEITETVTLSVLQGDQAAVVYQAVPKNSVLTVDWRGTRAPLHLTASGKVFLAYLSARQRRSLLVEPLERRTDKSMAEIHELEKQLIEIWDRGYGTCLEELEDGLNAISAPVRDPNGKVVAAISISGPEFRLSGEQLETAARRLMEAVRRLGQDLEIPGE